MANLPFELVRRGERGWWARWKEEKLGVEVGGTEEAPDAAMVATLADTVGRWAEVKAGIAAYLRGLATDHHVPLDPASVGGFAARSCGFDEEPCFQSIEVTAPGRVVTTFYTGYPDGYATFELVLEGGVPVALGAFAS